MATPFNDIRGIVEGVEQYVSKRTAALCDDFAVELSAATPEDTTHAASNWIWRDRPTETPEGSKEVVVWSAFYEGLSALAGYSIRKGALYMTNAVDYIVDLDDPATSPQQDPGWVSRVIRSVLVSRQ